MATQSAGTADQLQHAIRIAQTYIESKKHWLENEYRLQVFRSEGDPGSAIVVVDAVHREDSTPGARGSGKSVQLHIDLRNQTVLRELGYQ
jgi:hypothetical protein